jgi:group I intron endonuclease
MAIEKPKVKPISGIYLIKCVANDKSYIGSSNDVMRRIKTHKRDLDRGSHNNLMLQHEYTKYGAENFIFKIIDQNIEEDMLLAYEKCYMYIYDSVVRYKGYNQMFSTVNHKQFKEAYKELVERGVINRKN